MAGPVAGMDGVQNLLGSGPFLMILASAAFTSMVACTRFARTDMGGVDLVFWRAAVSLPMLLVAARGASLALRNERGAFLLRAVFGFASMSTFYIAARDIDMLTLALCMRLQPILVTLAAPYLLDRSEFAGRGVLVAALVGFAGSAILMGADLSAGSAAAWFAVATPFFSAAAHLALRKVAPSNSGTAIVFWFHVVMMPLAVLTVGIEGRVVQLPSREVLGPVLGVGLFAALGQLFMTRAYRLERAAIVATASYTEVVFALAYDVLLFGHTPTLRALPGGVLVLASSLYMVIRARRRRAIGLVS